MGIQTESNEEFAPFYTDAVSITGTRAGGRFSGTFAACVFDQGLDEAFGEDASSARRRISVLIPTKGEFAVVAGRPQVGDLIRFKDGSKFKVDRVSLPLGCDWEMEARQA